MPRQKLPPETQWEKRVGKEYITCASCVAPVASLKTLHEKTQWEKTHQGKKSTTVHLQDQVSRTSIYYLDLQDLLIFRTAL
jgi:hypothetical protein